MKNVNLTHRSPAALGMEGIKRQDEHERILEARRLADRVDAAAPPAPAVEPRRAGEAARGSGATASASPGSRQPRLDSAPQGGSPRPAISTAARKGPTVIEVGKARERQAERRARRAELDRIDAALNRALAQAPLGGPLR